MNRTEFNRTHPVGGDYSDFLQTKQFMKENPVCPPGEMPPPVISENMGLSLAQALQEHKEIDDAPSPAHGWSDSVARKIEMRLTDLKAIVFKHVYREKYYDSSE